jgi:hypothetical protein
MGANKMDMNWDLLIENHFKDKKEKKETLSLNTLMESVNEVMAELEAVDSILLERPESGPKAVSFDYSAIPMFPVSELSWASLESNDEGAVKGRQQLEQFLSRISGDDIGTKLDNITKVMNDPVYAQQMTGGDSQASKIANTLAYLIFFKTLTTVVTNFNAASAGFNFEAFLAVLLGGGQIPASGADTIADLTDAAGTPISLKLYQETSLKSGGSMLDLFGDLISPPYYMQYVVVAKTLKGKSTQRSGTLDFMRYNITLDNVMNLMFNSAHAKHHIPIITLPKAVVSGEMGLDFEIPKVPSLGQVKRAFDDELRSTDLPEVEELIRVIDYGHSPKLFSGKTALSPLMKTASPKRASAEIKRIYQEYGKALGAELTEEQAIRLHGIMQAANNKVTAISIEAATKRDALTGATGKDAYATAEESVNFYNRLSTEQKAQALLLTKTMSLPGAQYALTRQDIYNITKLSGEHDVLPSGQSEVSIGKIEIGQDKTQEMLNTMVNDINAGVFEIFQNVKTLSDSLQTYFANAMEDSSMAETAIESSQNIEVKTKEVSDIN